MKANKSLTVLLVTTLSVVGAKSAFADWQIVNNHNSNPSPRGEGGGEVARDRSGAEREFLTLLDRAGLGKKTPVDYKGRIQLLGGLGSWEDDSKGNYSYEKLVANMFGRKRFVWGVTTKHEEYSGEKTSEDPDVEFGGESFHISLSGEYRNFSIDRWGFSGLNIGGNAGYMLSKTNVKKVDGSFLRKVETDAGEVELFVYLHRKGTPFIKLFSMEGLSRFDAGSYLTENTWDGDTPGSRTYREWRARLHTRRLLWESISLNAGYKSSHEAERHFQWEGGVVGASIWDCIYADYDRLHGNGAAHDKESWAVSIDFCRAVPKLWRTVRGWFGSKDKGPVANDWQLVR